MGRLAALAWPPLQSSMSAANCFIVLEHGRGKVAAGEKVQVQLFEGLV